MKKDFPTMTPHPENGNGEGTVIEINFERDSRIINRVFQIGSSYFSDGDYIKDFDCNSGYSPVTYKIVPHLKYNMFAFTMTSYDYQYLKATIQIKTQDFAFEDIFEKTFIDGPIQFSQDDLKHQQTIGSNDITEILITLETTN